MNFHFMRIFIELNIKKYQKAFKDYAGSQVIKILDSNDTLS